MKKLVFIAITLIISQLGFSQSSKTATSSIKFAYVYEDYILQNCIDVKNLQAELVTKKQGLDTQFAQKKKEYQERYNEYQAVMKDITNITTESLNQKLKTVQESKKVADDFQANAEVELQKLIQEKFTAIREKTNATIKTVAAEKGYKIVFRRNIDANNNESSTVMIYSADNGKDDLTDAVLVKMGSILPPKK